MELPWRKTEPENTRLNNLLLLQRETELDVLRDLAKLTFDSQETDSAFLIDTVRYLGPQPIHENYSLLNLISKYEDLAMESAKSDPGVLRRFDLIRSAHAIACLRMGFMNSELTSEERTLLKESAQMEIWRNCQGVEDVNFNILLDYLEGFSSGVAGVDFTNEESIAIAKELSSMH